MTDFTAAVKKKGVDMFQEKPNTLILAEDETALYLQTTLAHIWLPVGEMLQIRITPQRDQHRCMAQ